jgi:protein tyrosine phosphatase
MPRTKQTFRPVNYNQVFSKVLIARCIHKYRHDKTKLVHNLKQLGRSYKIFDPYNHAKLHILGMSAEQFVEAMRTNLKIKTHKKIVTN